MIRVPVVATTYPAPLVHLATSGTAGLLTVAACGLVGVILTSSAEAVTCQECLDAQASHGEGAAR